MDQPLYLLVTCLTQALCLGLFLVSEWCDPCPALWHHVVVAEDAVHVGTGDARSTCVILGSCWKPGLSRLVTILLYSNELLFYFCFSQAFRYLAEP